MNVVNNSVKKGLAAAALLVICSAQVSLAGYTSVLSNNVGQVSASLGSTATGSSTNKAITGYPVTNPSAGVTTVGTWTARVNQPTGVLNVCTSTVVVQNLFGYKAVAKSYNAGNASVSADPSPDLIDKLAQEGFVIEPNPCGSGYAIASGEETINGQRFLVVLGNATGGTAAWFRGYFFDGVPTGPEDLILNGTKLYDVVITGPFDFGDINSPERCNALKIPINYRGPKLYLLSDGGAVSTTDIKILGCPSGTVNLDPCNPSYTNLLQTSGGCGAVTITYNPPSVSPGSTGVQVTATAMDASGNFDTCQFAVSRPLFQFTDCPGTFPILCGSPVAYPTLHTSGGCAPVNITFDKAASTLGPGNTLVTATARDASGQVATCQFTVSRPYLDLGSTGFGAPVNGPGGSCNPPAPTAVVKGAGNNVPIKFTTYLCNSPYSTGRTATITIKKLDTNCQPTIEINGLQLTPTSATYHFQWKTLVTDIGFFQITVNLNDGNPNPLDPKLSAIVQLTP
jgi:hypothetical protein